MDKVYDYMKLGSKELEEFRQKIFLLASQHDDYERFQKYCKTNGKAFFYDYLMNNLELVEQLVLEKDFEVILGHYIYPMNMTLLLCIYWYLHMGLGVHVIVNEYLGMTEGDHKREVLTSGSIYCRNIVLGRNGPWFENHRETY
jgi:hypothetical protein